MRPSRPLGAKFHPACTLFRVAIYTSDSSSFSLAGVYGHPSGLGVFASLFNLVSGKPFKYDKQRHFTVEFFVGHVTASLAWGDGAQAGYQWALWTPVCWDESRGWAAQKSGRSD